MSIIIFAIPVFVWAQVGIPCGVDINGDNIIKNMPGVKEECDFDSLIQLANNIIKFLMFSVAVPLAALGFMFVGAKMVMSPNKESAKTDAKQSLEFIAIGFLIMLAAYILIKTFLFALLSKEQVAFMQFVFQ